jgi:hypothetical protein
LRIDPKINLAYAEGFFSQVTAPDEKFLLLARKLCKAAKMIDERAVRRAAGWLFHILINTCVQNLMTAKYL